MKDKITYSMETHLAEVNEHYTPIYLGLYGSQNYGLSTEDSDVDTKAIVFPTITDIALGHQMTSKTICFEDGAQCDVKDVRHMVHNFLKQNINFLEILFTEYYYSNAKFEPFVSFLRDNAERIAHYNPVACIRAMYGMAFEKFKALEKVTPASKLKIEKWGYDPKQLLHIVRLREFMEDYIKGKTFAQCLDCGHKEYLLKVKHGDFELGSARTIAETELKVMQTLVDKYEVIPGDATIKSELDDALVELFKGYFREV